MGGIETATALSPLEAISSNPAALSNTQHLSIDLGASGGFLDAHFQDHANPGGVNLNDYGFLPSTAIAAGFGRFHLGFGVYASSLLNADWRYRDSAGGADGATTYGARRQDSQIVLIRTAIGASYLFTDQFSAGASVGLLYNRNRLDAPYIFQSQPVLHGAKTLLDLQTDGWGWDLQAGALWKPLSYLRFGVAYTSEARIHTTGDATGNANVQLANLGLGAARSDFAYHADVTTVFPQKVTGGFEMDPVANLHLSGQVDWINWADSFRTLSVHLRNGNNADLNGLVGANKLDDTIPLHWHNQFVLRVGAEYLLSPNWTVRAGYSFCPDPVPSDTLTPLTAAIAEHTITAGLGYHRDGWRVDAAWQWALPVTDHVDQSSLASGEYDNSTVRVGSQWLGLTAGVDF